MNKFKLSGMEEDVVVYFYSPEDNGIWGKVGYDRDKKKGL